MPTKESFDIDGLMVFRSDLTAVDQDGNIVASVTTPDKYVPSLKEPLSGEQIGRYTNTTAYWREHSTYIPLKGDVIVYSDGSTTEQGGVTVYVPKIKIGDGVTTIGNLPFTDSDTQQGMAGTLDTTNTSAQTPSSSESLSGNVNLHKVAKTGDYGDLLNKPTIPTVNDATLTIQKNGTTVDTFSANASQNKTINITVPTTASDVGALPSSTKYGSSISMTVNQTTFVVTAQLKDQDGNNLGNAQTIDLPLESVVVSGSYNAQTKKVILTLQNGSTIEFSVADLVAGLQSEITAQNPLSADLVVDGTTNKVLTLTMKTKLDGIEEGAEVNVQADWSETDTTSDAYILHKPDLDATLYESVTYSQLVTKINNSQLVKGRKYRITDYVTTTTQTDTSSAGHVFDLVVTAIDVDKLDYKASALLHEGDTYFSTAGSDLSKWQIWYDVNNDTNKYVWADTTNGKGVIYRMIDEWDNDCPYDFKNILFTVESYTNVYTFNRFANGDSANSDHSLNKQYHICYGNIMKEYVLRPRFQRLLNFIVFNNTANSFCYNNIFKNGCYYNIFGHDCYGNVFGINCIENTFGNYCFQNEFGNNCVQIKFGHNCIINTFGGGCNYITFGDSSSPSVGGNNFVNIIVENGNQYIRIYNTDNTYYLQNIYISQGCSGTYSAYTEISTIARNLSYRTTVGRDSSGNIRIYNEDDPASASQAQANWNETSSSSPSYIQNKPTIPAAQVNSDWDASSGMAQILNKPNLATVATSGSYDDLSNTPDLSSYVSGPSVATEENIAVYDGTTGKLVKDADISVIRLYENVEYLDNTISNPYYIARTTGKWAGSTSNAHRILDLTNIRKVIITARSNREAQYTFLKSYTEPDSEDVGETPDYANGYTTAVQIAAGTTQSLTVPADANYLYILVSTSYTYTPTSLKITGIGITEHSGTGSGFVKDDGSVDSTSYEPALPSKTNNENKVLAVGNNGTSLVWVKPVTIYSGTSEPSSSVGSDGDIYIKTTA